MFSKMLANKTANEPKPSETTQNQLKTIQNHPETSETTWIYLQPTQNFPN